MSTSVVQLLIVIGAAKNPPDFLCASKITNDKERERLCVTDKEIESERGRK